MTRSSTAPAAGIKPGPLGRVGRACHRHRWITLIGWLAVVACLVTLRTMFGAAADNNFAGTDPGQALLNQHFHRQSGDTLTLAISTSEGISSPAVQQRVARALAPFQHAAHVTSVSSPYRAPGQISRDGHIAFATVQFDVPSAKIAGSEVTALMNEARAASGGGVRFSLGGDLVDTAETPGGGSSDGIGLAAAAIVLLIAFGSVLAMGLPIATAVAGIGAGLSLIALLGHLVPAPSFAPIIATLIGLGVGIDYALFIVTRFRESLRAGATPEQAAATALRTAGRTVLIAGTTVVIGLLGLLVLRQPLLSGVAIAAAAAVAMTLLASLTLLPALLGFTGTRLTRRSRLLARRRNRPATAGRPGKIPTAQRWAGMIQRHPVISAVLSAGVILALAAPALGMKLSMPDESAQARGTMGYASYAAMAKGFGPGVNAPLIVAAQLPSPDAPVQRLAAAVAATPGVVRVTPVQISPDRQAAMMIAYPATSEHNPATGTLVNQLRGHVLPRAAAGTGIRAYLTGPNAGAVSFANLIGQRLPWLVGIVVALAMALLLVMFRSVTIALKAAVMNLLSICAAYGVLVLVTQHGIGGRLLGFPETMPVTTWVPMFLFVILFGLSMDYEVFLLSRIREDYDATGDNAASVARGLARTARVITAAAAIMVVVFLSIALGADVGVKQIGLGLAAAVLIDATLVRLVLVPAVMELLGKANWWLPTPLARLLPKAPLTEDETPTEAKIPAAVAD
ncbi:MAG TPA: MMPL family transporter [Streptosporangiaceae bacterium]